ncbi:ethanolamine utilization protein EutJ [Sesbania bispinosa]|nr:ethanolamine utilization protein EutJ [Sesbania bispinosa]
MEKKNSSGKEKYPPKVGRKPLHERGESTPRERGRRLWLGGFLAFCDVLGFQLD